MWGHATPIPTCPRSRCESLSTIAKRASPSCHCSCDRCIHCRAAASVRPSAMNVNLGIRSSRQASATAAASSTWKGRRLTEPCRRGGSGVTSRNSFVTARCWHTPSASPACSGRGTESRLHISSPISGWVVPARGGHPTLLTTLDHFGTRYEIDRHPDLFVRLISYSGCKPERDRDSSSVSSPSPAVPE
jgi:hypothetical protein